MSVYWKKRYGQHLLHDKNILRKIAGSLDLKKDDAVLEIGCGSGALTEYLVNEAAKVTAVEVDEQFFDIINEKFGATESFELVKGDILEKKLELILSTDEKTVIAGNLPYNITSQILFYMIDYLEYISRMLFMVQKETAERITAPVRNKNRSILSVICQYHFEPEILFPVSKNSFYPVPNVDSAVILLTVKNGLDRNISKRLIETVKACFGKRRKTLKNNLKSGGYDISEIADRFDLSRRPEELSVNEFESLTGLITDYNKHKTE
ncbi:MAG: ribosomal RNA small subunit methyltransferase A [bacterium]|nr:ribosomal RNA small subunit methyltransferase A [bacterium]